MPGWALQVRELACLTLRNTALSIFESHSPPPALGPMPGKGSVVGPGCGAAALLLSLCKWVDPVAVDVSVVEDAPRHL